MDVRELSHEQLAELKESYFNQLLDSDSDILDGIDFSSDIPDEMIFEHYDGIIFTEDDFFCNLN